MNPGPSRLKQGISMFEVRPARPSDRDEILVLIREVLGIEAFERAGRLWCWQWEQDPRLEGKGYQGVVVTSQGEMIATMATPPTGLYLRGVEVEAVWYVDALVHSRRLRKALRESRRAGLENSGPDLSKGLAGLIFNQPDHPSYQMGKHLTTPMLVAVYQSGARDQPGTLSLARLISVKSWLGHYLGKPLGWGLGTLVDLFLPRIPKPRIPVRRLEGVFDARFDELWEEALESHEAITLRNSAFLNWRYFHHPERDYVCLVAEAGSSLLGYLVLGQIERHGQLRGQILDVLARSDDPEVLESLFSSALQWFRQKGTFRVECYTGSGRVLQVLERLGFRERLSEGKSMAVVIRPKLEARELYVTRGDGDGG